MELWKCILRKNLQNHKTMEKLPTEESAVIVEIQKCTKVDN